MSDTQNSQAPGGEPARELDQHAHALAHRVYMELSTELVGATFAIYHAHATGSEYGRGAMDATDRIMKALQPTIEKWAKLQGKHLAALTRQLAEARERLAQCCCGRKVIDVDEYYPPDASSHPETGR